MTSTLLVMTDASPSSSAWTFQLCLIPSVTVSFSIVSCTSTALDWVCSYLSNRQQFVKIGRHSSGLLDCCFGLFWAGFSAASAAIFTAYVWPVGSIIESFGVRYQQYADDTQLCLSMRANDAAHNLDILRTCSTAVRDWYLSNNLLQNADKSDVVVLGTANQLWLAAVVDSIDEAGVTLPVAPKLKSLGVRPATHVRRSCDRRSQDLQPRSSDQARSTSA